MERDLERQVERLAARLRDEGQAPERDLWPEIAAAIDRCERPRRRRPETWQLVSVAASLLLLVGMGLLGGVILPAGQAPLADGTPAAVTLTATEDTDSAGGLQAVDRAWNELRAALELDPNNTNLSRLVLLVHRSRGQLIRQHATDLIGPGF